MIPYEGTFPRKTNGSKSLGFEWMDERIASRCWFERSVKGDALSRVTVRFSVDVK